MMTVRYGLDGGKTFRPVVVARPPIKCAGGKTKLLSVLLANLPSEWSGTYHEPFLGGGALFFALVERDLVREAYLSDANRFVADVFKSVKHRRLELITLLSDGRCFRNDEATFKRRRAEDPEKMSKVERAAWFMYLNKTCFNGLTRFNRAGKFNTPFGHYKNPTICDEANIEACAIALGLATVMCADYQRAADIMRPGDLAYFDPPYLPTSKTANFARYTSDGFGIDDHRRLRNLAVELRDRGVHVMLSNSAAARGLYRGRGFRIQTVRAPRSVNSKGEGRGDVDEILVTSYGVR